MHFVETNLLIFKLPAATIRDGWQRLAVAGPEHLGSAISSRATGTRLLFEEALLTFFLVTRQRKSSH